MSVCQEIELTGTSSQSWERAAAIAIKRAIESFADHCLIRRMDRSGVLAPPRFTTEVVRLDVTLKDNGDIDRYRTTVRVSFVRAVQTSPGFEQERSVRLMR
jgi:flavin-binding protein dodecin